MVELHLFTSQNLGKYRAKLDLHWDGRNFTTGDGFRLSDIYKCDWFPDWLYIALLNQEQFYCYTDELKVRKSFDHITIFYGKIKHH